MIRAHVLITAALLLGGCASQAVPTQTPAPASCRAESGVTLQVLGSGGPIPDDGRASAGYLVWVDGRARALIDAGGGTFVRFGQAGASLDDLELVALSHLHTDHSAELPAFLKGTYFGSRDRELPIVGPSGAGPFPALGAYLESMFGESGAYAYLGWLLDPTAGAYSLRPIEVDHTRREPQSIELAGMQLEAVGVEHGPVPALGFRLHVGQTTIAFSGDQNGNNPAFAALARGADILVMHHAVPQSATGAAANLHARPSEIGTLAADAGVQTLVLSHHMQRALADLEGSKEIIASRYDGEVIVAEDLTCIRP